MKKLFGILAAFALLVGCSEEYDDTDVRNQIDDLNNKVTSIEEQIASLRQQATQINNDLAAIQAIANGIAITKVEAASDGGYTITFSNGKSYTIANGAKGDKGDKGDTGEAGAPATPMMRIDSEGFWQVSYDGGSTWEYPAGEKHSALGETGPAGDQGPSGEQGVTPRLSVDEEGYWTVSYDGGQTYERMKDAQGNEVKAVVSDTDQPVYASVFESVTLSEDGSTLVVVLAGTTEPIEIPVGGKALAQLILGETAVEGVQTFAAGETKSYTVVAPMAEAVKVIGVPDNWTATLKEMTLEVTAPATAAAATTRATADSATDVSLLVVMKNGLSTILKMEVALSTEGGGNDGGEGGEGGEDPVVPPTPGETKTFTLVAQEMYDNGTLGLPSGTSAVVALGTNFSTFTWNSIAMTSRMALTTSGNEAGEKVPVLYFYKTSKVEAGTLIKNNTPLGTISKITLTLIDNGAKKGNLFTMTETVGGVAQTVVSSNDNSAQCEHVYTFSAGNDGTFQFANPSDQDCKVVSIVVEYN